MGDLSTFPGLQTPVSRHSGTSVPRVDAVEKVRGETRYLLDRLPEGVWYGGAVRSPATHGRLRALRFDPSFDFTRLAVVLPADVPGVNAIRMAADDMPCLACDEVQYRGEPLALIAAPDRATLAAALAAVRPEIDPLPSLVGIDAVAALARGNPSALHDLHQLDITRGDVAAALASADVIVEGEYVTPPQEHVYLEMQGVVAAPLAGGGVRISGSLQCPYYIRPAVAAVLGVPPEAVIVEQWPTGGAFGGKEDYPSVIAAHAALLARACGRPVVVTHDRQQDIEVTTKRHASVTRLRTGVRRDGTFVALDAEFVIDGGAYVTLSPVVLSRGAIHLSGPYAWPSVSIRARAVRTNEPPAGAFRGFGAPQALFAIEAHVDEVAARLGLDPLEVRRRNLLTMGATTSTSQILRESVGIEPCLASVLRDSSYAARREACARQAAGGGDTARGVGLALFWHGGGFTGAGERKMEPRAAIELQPDGTLDIRAANTEFGQGTLTSIAQIAADACGLGMDLVRYPLPDTSLVPDSGPTVASRTTMIVGRLVELCARELVGEVGRRIGATPAEAGTFIRPDGARLDWHAAARAACDGSTLRVERRYEHPTHLAWDEETYRGDAYAAYSWGAVVAEVTVDRATLEVRCDEAWSTLDIGTVINPREARGQVEGGMVQALGYALLERVTYTPDGRPLENRLQTYVIPTSADVPALHVSFVEVPYSNGPFGAKGLGELPMNGLAPALRNAVRHALGAAPARLPMTPDAVLAALTATATAIR